MTSKPRQELNLFDSTSLIVGIIIGAGIYQMAPDIARGAGGWWGVIGIWALGGLLSLCGAMGYAELATTYPHEGGDYVYLGKAYGSWAGFLFGWAQLAIVRPGDIAVMAFAFGTYGTAIYDPFARLGIGHGQQILAAFAVILLTTINVIGVRQGKWTQNLLTLAKAAGLGLIIVAAIAAKPAGTTAPSPFQPLPYSLALIFVLFTYGGWNEMAYVAAEVKNPERNIVRALLLGTVSVTVLYLLANLSFLRVLGYEGLAGSEAVAVDAVSAVFPQSAAVLVSLLVCISALGAVNGLIFTGARISYALGTDYRWFSFLGRWSPRFGTPAASLIVQGIIAVLLIVALGSFLNAVLYTAATVYSFYLASTLSILVLRRKDAQAHRPFRVPLYPIVPLVFAAVCLLLIHGALLYKPLIAAVSGLLLLAGLLIWRLSGGQPRPS